MNGMYHVKSSFMDQTNNINIHYTNDEVKASSLDPVTKK